MSVCVLRNSLELIRDVMTVLRYLDTGWYPEAAFFPVSRLLAGGLVLCIEIQTAMM